MPRRFIMLSGPAGAGKSTCAKAYANHYTARYFSSDEVREELFGDASVQKDGAKVFETLNNRVFETVERGFASVVYDATNLYGEFRKEFLKQVKEHATKANRDYVYIIVTVKPSLARCLAQNQMRTRQVPEDIIKRHWNTMEMPTYDEGWDLIIDNFGMACLNKIEDRVFSLESGISTTSDRVKEFFMKNKKFYITKYENKIIFTGLDEKYDNSVELTGIQNYEEMWKLLGQNGGRYIRFQNADSIIQVWTSEPKLKIQF